METPKVSIILPIYNAGPYLTKCLDSLVNQTLKDIEIICVLDCPTDGSDKTVYEYAARDNRIKVIANEKNLHIGLSRNVGIENATGEYIGFMDHDDYCELNMYEMLYNAAEMKNAEVSVCNRACVEIINSSKVVTNFDDFTPEKHTCRSYIQQICSDQTSGDPYVIWSKIYKRDYILKNAIEFVDTKKVSGEDVLFNTKVFIQLLKDKCEIAHVPKVLYYHNFHSNNTGRGEYYLSHLIVLRNELSKSNFLCQNFDTDLYIGNIRYLYTLIRKKYFSLKELREANYIVSNLKRCYTLYNSQLTIPKNIFALILRLYTNFMGKEAKVSDNKTIVI